MAAVKGTVTIQAITIFLQGESMILIQCIIASKINGTSNVYSCPFRSYTQLKVKFVMRSNFITCSFSDNLTPFGVTFILLAMVQYVVIYQNKALNSQMNYFIKYGTQVRKVT